MKWIFISLGLMSVIGGAIVIWLPIPLGVPLFMIGLPLLMKYSPNARLLILHITKPYPKIFRQLRKVRRVRY